MDELIPSNFDYQFYEPVSDIVNKRTVINCIHGFHIYEVKGNYRIENRVSCHIFN